MFVCFKESGAIMYEADVSCVMQLRTMIESKNNFLSVISRVINVIYVLVGHLGSLCPLPGLYPRKAVYIRASIVEVGEMGHGVRTLDRTYLSQLRETGASTGSHLDRRWW